MGEKRKKNLKESHTQTQPRKNSIHKMKIFKQKNQMNEQMLAVDNWMFIAERENVAFLCSLRP